MNWQLYPTVLLPLKSLDPNTGQIEGVPANPRYLAEAKAAKLAKSMEQSPEMLGLREILVYPLGKKHVVIGGNMRMLMLKKAGHKDAPCKVIPAETTPEQLKRYVLIDNASFGDWEHEALANSWDDLVQDFCIDVPSFEEAGEDIEGQGEEFSLKDGDRAPFQQMTFTLADEQAEIIKNAMQDARQTEAFKYAETYGNENGNGNALYFIVAEWERLKK